MRKLSESTRDDRGVALVMAMGIALIGIVVAGVVITATVVAVNDSGRDRVRTTEIHSAEGAIDATMSVLQSSVPCPSPAFSGTTYGSGTQKTKVDVTLEYWDDAGVQLTCAGGVLSGTPGRAVITATSTAVNPQVGVDPERKLETEVVITPLKSPGANAAIFSAKGLTANASFLVEPANAGESADVWIDSGDWSCSGGSGQMKTVGSIYVPGGTVASPSGGSLSIANNCFVSGNVWVQNNFETTATADANAVTGNLTVRQGTVDIKKPSTVGGWAKLGGASHSNLTAVGGISANLGATAIPNLTGVGLPQVKYVASDWTSSPHNFSTAGVAELKAAQDAAWGLPKKGSNDPCSSWSNTTPVQLAADTVYDLTSCAGKIDFGKAVLSLTGDTALIIPGATVTTTFHVVSGDGQPHNFWMIVPYVSGATCGKNDAYSIYASSTDIVFDGNISAFIYGPGMVSFNPHGLFRGQIYGGCVTIKNDADMKYVNVGVPGIDLAAGTSTIIGYDVEIVYKREVS